MNLSIFADRLSDLIQEAGLSAPSCALQIGVSKVSLYRYLAAKHVPSLDVLLRMARLFRCSLQYLLGLKDTPETVTAHDTPETAAQLKKIFAYYGVTEYKLHKALNISRSVLFSWLTGKSTPSADSLIVLSEYFDCTVDHLIGHEN